MKKICACFVILSLISILTTACASKQAKPNMVQSKRKYADFMEPQNDKNVIDLSEGPRQNYDAHFGPKSLNFDIKVVDPY